MTKKTKVLVLKTDGINCDEELQFAFQTAGAVADIVHVNTLRTKKHLLDRYQILAIPGGFSYGDDVVSGKVLAVELTSFFSESLQAFMKRKDTQILGICNGFQVLVRTGLLPFNELGKMSVTLSNNESGHFECRWINLKMEKRAKGFLSQFKDVNFTFPVAHGEGRFFTSEYILEKIEKQNLVALRYVDDASKATMSYPQNPNGALHAIAGITDISGRIIGLMPHPERYILPEQHPNFRRFQQKKPDGLKFFERMVTYAKEL